MDILNEISKKLGDHYGGKFAQHGPTSEGVDWGSDPADHRLRLDRMLAVLDLGIQANPSILDVGCGFGSLMDLITERGLSLEYSGIDMSELMINSAKARHNNVDWFVGDALKIEGNRIFDYVVCNGVFTQKLETSIKAMDLYLYSLVTRMFELCRIGIAFNVMTTHVNFMASNLFYKNPVELMGWCLSALTSKIRLDHAYPMYEYTIYLYREDAPGLTYGSHRGSSL
jgi:SAM-dependent methyltransferase